MPLDESGESGAGRAVRSLGDSRLHKDDCDSRRNLPLAEQLAAENGIPPSLIFRPSIADQTDIKEPDERTAAR